MDVRVEVDEIAEGLNEKNHAWSTPRADACIGPHEQPLYDVAQPAQQRAPAGEDRPQHAGQGEYVLPVRNRRKHVRFDPFAVGEHALLVATRAEVPRLAREREDAAVAAIAAAQPREAVMRIAAFEEALNDTLFEQPLQAPLGSEFRHVTHSALVKRTRSGIARPICSASWRPLRRSRTWLAAP